MQISVIVPVGDEEAWCICRQSLENSINLLGQNCGIKFEVLPCFDLEHRGVSMARNEGLAKATGDWIAWVDCDDEVDLNWAREICVAISSHPDVDVIQFDVTEAKKNDIRLLPYKYKGYVDGETFAHEVLRNDGMPAWLVPRIFKRELFKGKKFVGSNKEDYGMFLQVLPKIRNVWSIGKSLYRYNRHGAGLSNYAQNMDYRVAGCQFESLIAELPSEWRHDANVGLALTMADVARHSRVENGARRWVRKYLWSVLFDLKVPMRLKVKSLMAAIGV